MAKIGGFNMSKWIDKDLFSKYVEQKEKEIDTQPSGGLRRSDFVWPTPASGTADKPKVYEGRLLQDPKGLFTKKYYYHMWKSGDKMMFYLCPKTEEFSNWCPMCSITSKLYTGTENDKKSAYDIKRKERHVTNFYVVDDPRDKEQENDEKKSSGKVKVYEFPSKLESKIKAEILDKKEGLGHAIFDPGPEGYNLLIKVATTKADKSGKTYPDYANSTFSRRSSALGSDKEIDVIMKSRFSLNDYLNSLKTSDEDLQKLLKTERLWDMIEDEWIKIKGAPLVEQLKSSPDTASVKEPTDVKEFDNPTDEDLLAELESL